MQTRSSPNLQTLHSLASEASIPEYEKLSKSALFDKLKKQYDFERLQRTENRRSRINEALLAKKRAAEEQVDAVMSSSSSDSAPPRKRVFLRATNKIDPIMFTPIKKTKSLKLQRSNGTVIAFNVDTLIDYMVSTGDFSDPETRVPFTESELSDVDKMAVKLKLDKPSVVNLKNNPSAFADYKFRRDALLGLERCAGEVVSEILNIIEEFEPDEAQMRIILRELPAFADYFRQIREADLRFASQCMSHWILFLEGPPNKPNEDVYGLLEIVCEFFRRCDNGTAHFSVYGLGF